MRLYALDIFRFIAALSVVLYHYISREDSIAFPDLSQATKFGYLGVPFFFMISGFVIALSASNRSAIEFAISRFVRLYPALWIGVIFTSITLFIFTDKPLDLKQVLANLTLINDYFGFEDIDGVYWTLKAELKFYACIFILLLFGIYSRYKTWISIWLAATYLYAFTSQPFFMGWFITPHYSSFFIAGIALYLIFKKRDITFAYTVLAITFPLSIYKAYYQADGFIRNPDSEDRVIITLIILAFYILLYLLSINKIKIKNNQKIVTIGAITYPLYLIHNMAGKSIIDHFSYNRTSEIAAIAGTTLFIIFTAWVIYKYLEKPLAHKLKNHLLNIFENKIGRA